MAKKPAPEQHVIATFTSQQWPGKPGQDGLSMFVGFGVIGLVLSLVLMILIPPLRSFGAVMLFSVIFAVIFTTLMVIWDVSSKRAYLQRLTAKVNSTVLELTGDPNAQLSVPQFRAFILNEKHRPLSVNGVPGLDLAVVRQPPVKIGQNFVTTSRLIVTVSPLDYGIESFDRLLDAADGDTDNRPY